MPSYAPMTLPESEKDRSHLVRKGVEGFELIDKCYGPSSRQRRPTAVRFTAVDDDRRSTAVDDDRRSTDVDDDRRSTDVDDDRRSTAVQFTAVDNDIQSTDVLCTVADDDKQIKAVKCMAADCVIDDDKQISQSMAVDDYIQIASLQCMAVDCEIDDDKQISAVQSMAVDDYIQIANLQCTAVEDDRQRPPTVESEVVEKSLHTVEREAEEEKLARYERDAGAKSWAKLEREAKEQRTRAERMAEKVSQIKAQLIAEEESRAKVEREAKEQRTRVEKMVEEVSQARAQLIAEVERRVRAEREVEEERQAKTDRGVEEDRQVKAKRKKEEERGAKAKRMEEMVKGETLYKAICANNWTRAKAFLDENPSELTAKITSSGKTALHVAALFGHVSIVEELVAQVKDPTFLETTDDFRNTPLLIATVTGITPVAECLVNKNPNILRNRNSTGELPITLAFLNGHQEMGRYLYSKTPLEYLHPDNKHMQGAMLLRFCLQTQCFDIALDLLNRCQELLFVSDKEGWKTIYGIATMNSAIPSRNELVFWKRFIFDYIDINSNPSLDHDRLPVQQQGTTERAQKKLAWPIAALHGLLERVISSTYNNLIGIKKIQELKLLHAQADGILDLVCKSAISRSDQVRVYADALFLAAKEGNVEFVLQISKANPDLLLICDSSYQNMFCYAVRNRQARVFNLIHGLRFKDIVATSKDTDGNTLLHVAATQAPPPFLNRIYGPTLQMQRELQWFKLVESLIPPTIRGARNKDGMSADELFSKSHRDLMKHGEEWVKATATSCSVVGTLIVTIMFTITFTVPGGNDQNSGYPLFIKQPFFKIFLFSTIISFASSSTSVLIFLAIRTSHYSEEKFLRSIPTKLVFGLFSLFISIVSMMIAFIFTIFLMLKDTNYRWGVLPIITLAIIPIVLFVLSQFPLLLHSSFSTFGNIFNRKPEMWP